MVKAEQAKTVKSKKASLVKLNKLALPSLYHYVIKIVILNKSILLRKIQK